MFFGNDEPAKTKPPIRLTVVTGEYLIDAWDDPELSVFTAAFDASIDEPNGGNIILKDAQVRSFGRLNTPARTFSEWRVPSLAEVIAIVSDDPAAEDLLIDGWLEHEHPFRALIYTGPFTVEGRILSPEETPPTFLENSFIPIEDALLTYRLDEKTTPIRGRWGVVNFLMAHGWSLES